MKVKITDLEDFVSTQIRDPYRNMIPTASKIRLNNVIKYHALYTDWWLLVINRIKGNKFYFPSYIKHELVDLINLYIRAC